MPHVTISPAGSTAVALFPIADVVRRHKFDRIEEAPAVKRLFFDLIVKYRKMKNRGVVAVFEKRPFRPLFQLRAHRPGAVLAAKGAAWRSWIP